MRQSPKYFSVYLAKLFQKQGLHQPECKPCLFIGKKVIVITYVDDQSFYAWNANVINQLIESLHADDIWIHCEDTAERFLGIDISHNYASPGSNPTVTLTQKGLTSPTIKALGPCTSFTTKPATPPDMLPLPKDSNGTPAFGAFNYAAIIGMLLYLSSHSCPNNEFAVHQCACYTFATTALYEYALK